MEFLRIYASARLGATPMISDLHAVQIPARVGALSTVTPALISRYHRAGVEVHVWTVNDPKDMRELLDMGVDGIVTDRADLALDVIQS